MNRTLAAVVGLAIGLSAVGDAAACGCLAPPVPDFDQEYAVNQQSEQILFEIGPGTITAHVLIRYAGDPESFAWLVPVPALPQIELSHVGAFARVDSLTQPRRSATTSNLCPTQRYACRQHPPPICPVDRPASTIGVGTTGASSGTLPDATSTGGYQAADGSAANTAADAVPEVPKPPPVTVYSRQQIGSYETVVFGAEEADAAVGWLETEGFIVNETMSPFMQPYLDDQLLFVASKLVPGADVDEIRPLKMTYEGTTPGIPLRLTAIAAEPHLMVTAFIFSDRVFEPVGHPLVELDATRLAYSRVGSGDNYLQLLSRSIDEAGGDAFVHEYSGRLSGIAPHQCCTREANMSQVPGSTLLVDPISLAAQDPFADSGAMSVADAGANDAMGMGDAGAVDAGAMGTEDAGASTETHESDASPLLEDWCNIGGDSTCQCPAAAFDAEDCGADAAETQGTLDLINQLASYPVVTRLTTRLSADEMIFDPFFEPVETAMRGGLQLTGVNYQLDSCSDDIVDSDSYERLLATEACAGVYCDLGSCAIAQGGEAGCVCNEGFVARIYTEGDGSPAVTCVPEWSAVDFAAGGLDLPDACAEVDVENGSCLDVGGFASVACAPGHAAVVDTLAVAQRAPSCSPIEIEVEDAGGFNLNGALQELKVCAPPAPNCPSQGWLEELSVVSVPGEDCERTRPEPSRFDIPPAPTCPDTGALADDTTGAASTNSIAGSDSVQSQPSASGGCQLGGGDQRPWRRALPWALGLLLWAARRSRPSAGMGRRSA